MPGANSAIPYAINSVGQVAGFSGPSFVSVGHAFIYSGGQMQDLGAAGYKNSLANSINDLGQAVGILDNSSIQNGITTFEPFLYSNGSMTVLPTLGGTYGEAVGINNAGEVVGTSATTSNAAQHAFLYSGGAITDLNSFAQNSGLTLNSATAINASGQIVGDATTADGHSHAFIYSAGTVTDLGTLGGENAYADGINNAGQVVGFSETAGGALECFLYSGGTMTKFGMSGSPFTPYLVAINDNGQAVGMGQGNYDILYSDGVFAFLNGIMLQSGWNPQLVFGINDSGQIIGFGDNMKVSGGIERAFLLTPVPEPGTTAFVVVALEALLIRRRR